MKQAFTPYRTDEVIALARNAARRFAGRTIDEIAETEGIILVRLPDAHAEREGFCSILSVPSPKPFASAAATDEIRYSFTEEIHVTYPAIVINPLRCKNEAVVFWHEYYHLLYSPYRSSQATFFDGYSTRGVLDKQEERRANLFATHVIRSCSQEDDDLSLQME
ncbi:MAG: hypothetical protein JSS75_09410 [Bacteroidetes bacterium]|nr:hypothetical protein [Bacteroidota bacterium]